MLGVGAGSALLAVAALSHANPMLVLGLAAIAALTAIFGIEALIVVSFLGACGLLPFVNPNDLVVGQIKVYALLFMVGLMTMLLAWALREVMGKERWPLPANSVSLGLLALLAYVLIIGFSSEPTQVPALAVPFFILPLFGLAVILWLRHPEALEGLNRMLPLAVVIVAAWAIAYDAGAAGCGTCQNWVGTELTKVGLLGSSSRLYTSGQNSFLAFFLIAFAFSLYRPGRTITAFVALGGLTIALQNSRAQYIAVFAGILVLLVWKLRQLPSGGRVALILLSALGIVVLIVSPVGQHAVSVYTELQHEQGTGTYRLQLIHTTSQYWTVFGQGFSARSLGLGVDVDLGLPNTLLILGYLGAALQLFLLAMGIWRGMKADTIAGVTIAAILTMVLFARPSLPLLEYGHSAVMYGAVLGCAAVVAVPATTVARARQARRQ